MTVKDSTSHTNTEAMLQCYAMYQSRFHEYFCREYFCPPLFGSSSQNYSVAKTLWHTVLYCHCQVILYAHLKGIQQCSSVGWSLGGFAGRFAFTLPYRICRAKLREFVTQENSSGDPVSEAAGGAACTSPILGQFWSRIPKPLSPKLSAYLRLEQLHTLLGVILCYLPYIF